MVTAGYSLPLDLALPNVPRGTLVSPNLRRLSPSIDGRLSPLEPVAIGACSPIQSARSLKEIWSEYIQTSLHRKFLRSAKSAHHFRVAWLAARGSIQKCATLWGGQSEGIFENLTEKMNHEEHEGTRRSRVGLLRVFFVSLRGSFTAHASQEHPSDLWMEMLLLVYKRDMVSLPAEHGVWQPNSL